MIMPPKDKDLNNNDEFNYRNTAWRKYVEYRFSEIEKATDKVISKVDSMLRRGIVTPEVLDARLDKQQIFCASQFEEVGNPKSEEDETAFSLARWGIKEFGVFGFQAIVIVILGIALLKEMGVF